MGSEEPIINIRGERVALGPLRRELVPTWQRWMNDFAVMRTWGTPVPRTEEQAITWFEREGMRADEGGMRFLIYEAATARPIGHTGLYNVDFRNRTALFGIMIGEADCWGKGYATEATRLMLDYAFTALGLHSVALETDGYNLAAQRVYTKAGFRVIGRRRECQLLNGNLYDIVYMDCLATEFENPLLGRVFAPDVERGA